MSPLVLTVSQLASENFMCGFNPFSDMRWFGNAIPLISMGKKTVKQPVHVSLVKIFPLYNKFKLAGIISEDVNGSVAGSNNILSLCVVFLASTTESDY